MFRRCTGFGKRKSIRDDDSTSSSECGLEHLSRIDHSISKATERFVLEIVGALGLNVLADDVDPYCTVSRVSSAGVRTKLHRTKTIANDTAPIWTLKTKSICFVELDKGNPSEQLRIELCHSTVGIPGVSDTAIVGSVNLTYATLLANGDAARRDYPVAPNQYPGILLALRFRKATPHDFKAFQELQHDASENLLGQSCTLLTVGAPKDLREDHAGDIDFEHVTPKGLLGNFTTVVQSDTEQKAYRVWPYPDPDNPKETTYMTKAEIHQAAMEPSRHWVEATGGGADNYGSVFLEIIGCDDLPNMVSSRPQIYPCKEAH
jgi:C2 domain